MEDFESRYYAASVKKGNECLLVNKSTYRLMINHVVTKDNHIVLCREKNSIGDTSQLYSCVEVDIVS